MCGAAFCRSLSDRVLFIHFLDLHDGVGVSFGQRADVLVLRVRGDQVKYQFYIYFYLLMSLRISVIYEQPACLRQVTVGWWKRSTWTMYSSTLRHWIWELESSYLLRISLNLMSVIQIMPGYRSCVTPSPVGSKLSEAYRLKKKKIEVNLRRLIIFKLLV